MFDGLVRRSIFADSNGVVSKDVNHRQFHNGTQANRRTRVIAEDEELRAERTQLRSREAVEYRVHRVLADAEMQVASTIVLGAEVAGAVECKTRLRRGREVGRSADEPRHILRDRV